MIERNEDLGATIAYTGANMEPADADTATHVKIVFDDGRVMFLVAQDAVAAPTEEDDTEGRMSGQHDGDAWNRHRQKHKPRRLKINGHTLAAWARGLVVKEMQLIEAAIRFGISAGDSNTDVAHRVIGSRAFNGSNGATEITRQMILRLAKGHLRRLKPRMGGTSKDDPARGSEDVNDA